MSYKLDQFEAITIVDDREPTTPPASKNINLSELTSSSGGVLTGSLLMWPLTTAPTGYLICDGSAVDRTTYSTLFALIGTVFGIGDGSSTFNLPDYRGVFPVGYKSTDTDFDAIGKTGGAKTNTPAGTISAHSGSAVANHSSHTHNVTTNVTVESHLPHTHTISQSSFNTDNFTVNAGGSPAYVSGGVVTSPSGVPSATLSHNVTNNMVTSVGPDAPLTHSVTQPDDHSFTGSSLATVPPYMAINFIIKT